MIRSNLSSQRFLHPRFSTAILAARDDGAEAEDETRGRETRKSSLAG